MSICDTQNEAKFHLLLSEQFHHETSSDEFFKTKNSTQVESKQYTARSHLVWTLSIANLFSKQQCCVQSYNKVH